MNTPLRMIALASLAVAVAGCSKQDPSYTFKADANNFECSSKGGSIKIDAAVLKTLQDTGLLVIAGGDEKMAEVQTQSQSWERLLTACRIFLHGEGKAG